MKNNIILQFVDLDYSSIHTITFPYGVLKGNLEDQDYNNLICEQNINCRFIPTAETNKFLLSTSDIWSIGKKVCVYQNFNFEKEVYGYLGLNIIDLIKKSINTSIYVEGKCSASLLNDINGNNKDCVINYIIIGFDDDQECFIVRLIDEKLDYSKTSVSYSRFEKSLYDLPEENISLHLFKFCCEKEPELNLSIIKDEMADYLQSVDKKRYYRKNDFFGVDAVKTLFQYISDNLGSPEVNRLLKVFVQHKVFMFERMKYLSKLGYLNEELVQLSNTVRRMSFILLEENQKGYLSEKTLKNYSGIMLDAESYYLTKTIKRLGN